MVFHVYFAIHCNVLNQADYGQITFVIDANRETARMMGRSHTDEVISRHWNAMEAKVNDEPSSVSASDSKDRTITESSQFE